MTLTGKKREELNHPNKSSKGTWQNSTPIYNSYESSYQTRNRKEHPYSTTEYCEYYPYW